MTKKRIFSKVAILLLVALSLSFSLSAIAATNNGVVSLDVKEDVYIYDQDNCIDDAVEQELNQLLVSLEEKTEVEFAVISIPTLNNLTIEEYSNQLFNKLGIGKSGKDNGLLLLFSRADNKVRLEIGRGLEGCLNDSKCGRILDEYFVPYRAENKYTEATNLTASAVLNVICEEYDIKLENLEEVTIPEESEADIPTWLIILIIIILAVIVAFAESSLGGGSGGSYYGGSSSYGGGFSRGGGFGGGFSGGGGASR